MIQKAAFGFTLSRMRKLRQVCLFFLLYRLFALKYKLMNEKQKHFGFKESTFVCSIKNGLQSI